MTSSVYFSLNDCYLSFGKKKILDNVSISLHEEDKIALVGKNGAGKTSLLKIISGAINIDSGDIWFDSKIKVGFLNQMLVMKNNSKIYDSLNSMLDSEDKKYFIDHVCNELKLNTNNNIKELSGGEHRKFNLASILIKNPDLLLLDEPTNHLDIESIKWLEDYLNKSFRGAFLVTSHDRNFLKNVTNKVLWIDRNKIKLSPKGFLNFEKWSRDLIEQERRELGNKKKILNEELEWLSKGVTARRKRNIRRKNNILNFKESYEKQKSEFLKSISKAKINISEKNEKGPNILINFYKVTKTFLKKDNNLKKIIDNFTYKFLRGEKIGIIGRNGSGKSTFLKIINDKNLIQEGSIKIKKNIKINYFDQSGQQLNKQKSIKYNLVSSGGDYLEVAGKKIHVCGYLKNFLFDPKNIDQKVESLSGGEKNRLLLAKILSDPKDLLLLDEPTNDLDIETIDILIEFIKEYRGGVLIVSHDIDFLEKTVDKFFLLDGTGKVNITADYKKIFQRENFSGKEKIIPKSLNNKKEDKKKPESITKKINKILKKIENKEKCIQELSKKLENNNENGFDFNNNQKILNQIKSIQQELYELEKDWHNLEEKSMNEGV